MNTTGLQPQVLATMSHIHVIFISLISIRELCKLRFNLIIMIHNNQPMSLIPAIQSPNLESQPPTKNLQRKLKTLSSKHFSLWLDEGFESIYQPKSNWQRPFRLYTKLQTRQPSRFILWILDQRSPRTGPRSRTCVECRRWKSWIT